MKLIKRTSRIALLLLTTIQMAWAQHGMRQEAKYAFLIPMTVNNDLIGHAYVYGLDKVSKDSNSFALEIFDEYLHDVGEKKIMATSTSVFEKAAFNGQEIVVKFIDAKNKNLRYVFLNQKAEITFDTLVSINEKLTPYVNHKNYIPNSIPSLPNIGVFDYFQKTKNGKAKGCVNFISNDHKFWEYEQDEESNINYLTGNKTLTVNTLFRYRKNKLGNDARTYILGLSTTGGMPIFETDINAEDDVCIFPIAAHVNDKEIEVISQFTRKPTRFGRIKYGLVIHHLDLNGRLIKTDFNEFTQTMVLDSVVKKHKLLQYSYLFFHKAVKLKNGNWLTACEQLRRTYPDMVLDRKLKTIYNKKTMCLFEIKPNADVVNIHVEPNKEDGVQLNFGFNNFPHHGALSILQRDRMDISYFIQDYSSPNDKISFVFTDVNSRARKISLGNVLYNNGEFKTDRFNIPLFSSATRINILPARFGHVFLFKFDPYAGFDFDNIKFNF